MSDLPNLSVAVGILLTLPVSVATGERSFSKLKLIKNFVTMLQERLVNLARISIDHKIDYEIDVQDIVKRFAKV